MWEMDTIIYAYKKGKSDIEYYNLKIYNIIEIIIAFLSTSSKVVLLN